MPSCPPWTGGVGTSSSANSSKAQIPILRASLRTRAFALAKAMRAKCAAHPIEEVGAKLRAMMPWIKQRAMVDKSRN